MESIKNECDFKKYLHDNKPYSSVFLADTLAFILVTNNEPFMDILMCSASNEQRHTVINLMKAEGNDYDTWVKKYTKSHLTASTGAHIDDDVYDQGRLEAMVRAALDGDASNGTHVDYDDQEHLDDFVRATLNRDNGKDDKVVVTTDKQNYNEYNWGLSDDSDDDNDDDDDDDDDAFISKIEKAFNI